MLHTHSSQIRINLKDHGRANTTLWPPDALYLENGQGLDQEDARRWMGKRVHRG